MARLARVVAVDVPHHVTQRGDARQVIFAADPERMVYMDLLREAVQQHQLSLLTYCLMSNHVHLVMVPHRSADLALALKQIHGRYASCWNAAHRSSGHVWQGRFYSCPLDRLHLWQAMRYTELNPVRAGLVVDAVSWPWSSAAAHCGSRTPDVCLDLTRWRKDWSASCWQAFLAAGETEADLQAIRQCTHTGRPLGAPDFLDQLEQATHRRLTAQKGGRPAKEAVDENQELLFVKEE